MPYENTQKGKLHLILYIGVVFLSAFGSLSRYDHFAAGIFFCGALLCLIFGISVHTLTVKDQGDYLEIFSGPLPLFKKKIKYSEIEGVKIGRSDILDGWGLHYTIGRGWIINIWGFDCVVLRIGKKKFRIRTNDKARLFDFLKHRVERCRIQ